MAEIQLPNASIFSYVETFPGYQHEGLAKQVLAHQAAKLSRKLEGLLAQYQADVDAIEGLRQASHKLDLRINRLAKNSPRRVELSREQSLLTTQVKCQERALLSSRITIEISELRKEIKLISSKLSLSV